ncbi:MAG: DnaA/Hda family protein [Gemmatimonadota bacterium]
MTSPLDPRLTFEGFVVGPSNRLAAAAARRAAESPGTSYNPLVVYGGPGMGKTHLLNAVGHLARSVRPELRVAYRTIEEVVDGVSAALAAGTLDAFRDEYRRVNLLLLDDVQFLGGKGRTQDELLRVWDDMSRAGAQVVLASDRPPGEIEGLDPRLVSRLAAGLLVDVTPPETETRVAIARRMAAERGAELAPGTAEALGGLGWESVRELQGGLNRVLAVQEAEGRPVAAGEVAGLLGMTEERAPAADEFGAFLSDITLTVAEMVEAAPWRRALGAAILRWEGEGIRTRRLEDALEADSAPDVDSLLAAFAADVERLRAAEAALRALDPAAAASPVLRDPDRADEAEAWVELARVTAAPLAAPPEGPALDEIAARLGAESLAARSARRALGRPAAGYNPLLLHGAGAAELLAAIGRAAAGERPDARVAWLRAADVAAELTPALRAGAAEAWRKRYRSADLLLVDGLHDLPADERVQEEVFYLLDALLRSDVQVTASADRGPREMAALDTRLRSRFEGGLVVDLAAAPPAPDAAPADEAPPAPAAAPAAAGRAEGTDRWFYNTEKVAWSALALEDRLIEELA